MIIEKNYVTVVDSESLDKLLKHIQKHEIVAIDTETTSLNVREAQVIGFSVSGKPGESFYLPTLKYNSDNNALEDLFIENKKSQNVAYKVMKLLKNNKIVTHNGAYDLQVIENFYGIDLLPNLYIETLVLAHTVNENGARQYGKPFALKNLAKLYQDAIGLDPDEDANIEQQELKESIKSNGGSITKGNFEIYKASLDILCKYGAADTDLTIRLCYYLWAQLREQGLEKFFFEDEVMPVYREVTIPMEKEGIRVDLDFVQKIREEIEKDLAYYEEKVLSDLLENDEAKEWVLDMAEQKFTPKPSGQWGLLYAQKRGIPFPVTDSGRMSNTAKLRKRFLSEGKLTPEEFEFYDKKDASGLDGSIKTQISLKLWKDSNDGQVINIGSSQQLAEILFDYIGEKHQGMSDKTGKYVFDDEVIEKLGDKYEWVKSLRIFRKLRKIHSTYVMRFLTEHHNGRFYPYFSQHGTVSGRYGSNLQQLPKIKEEGQLDEIVLHYNNQVRAFLIADEGYAFIDADYESLEPHLFASISNDKNLQDIFAMGHDFYSTVAIRTEGLQGVSADKSADNYLKNVDSPKRSKAKAYSLGIAYGMSGYALAMTLGVSNEEGERLRNGYLDAFPGVKNWIAESRKHFKEHGFVRNMTGRVRHLEEGKWVYDRFGKQLHDRKGREEIKQVYGEKKLAQWYAIYKNSLNNCLNFQIQSLAASVVNRAALAINRDFKRRGWDGQVVAQIHDQLVIKIKEDLAKEAAKVVEQHMKFTTRLPGVELEAPPEIAYNLRDGH